MSMCICEGGNINCALWLQPSYETYNTSESGRSPEGLISATGSDGDLSSDDKKEPHLLNAKFEVS